MRYAIRICLVLSLMMTMIIAAGYSSYARTTHALNRAGAQTIVICGKGGAAENVTLDRNGERIDDTADGCAHCSDCVIASAFAEPSNPVAQLNETGVHVVPGLTRSALHIARRIEHPSRGPPSQKVV